MCSCCRTAVLGLLGGRRTAPLVLRGVCGATALVSFGVAGTTVGKLLEGLGTADGNGSATVHAADTIRNIPTMVQPVHRAEPRSWSSPLGPR